MSAFKKLKLEKGNKFTKIIKQNVVNHRKFKEQREGEEGRNHVNDCKRQVSVSGRFSGSSGYVLSFALFCRNQRPLGRILGPSYLPGEPAMAERARLAGSGECSGGLRARIKAWLRAREWLKPSLCSIDQALAQKQT